MIPLVGIRYLVPTYSVTSNQGKTMQVSEAIRVVDRLLEDKDNEKQQVSHNIGHNRAIYRSIDYIEHLPELRDVTQVLRQKRQDAYENMQNATLQKDSINRRIKELNIVKHFLTDLM